MSKIIEWKGKTYETSYDYPLLSKEELEFLRKEYYKKPDFEDVRKEFKCIDKGGSKNTNITNYYVRDLMDKTLNYSAKWSIEDLMASDELLSLIWYKTKLNKKVFLDTESVRRRLDTVMRLSGAGLAVKPGNFPIKTIDLVLNKYNVNNKWYDFSCGWGARLTGALKHDVSYFGTDPNYLLTEKLEDLATDYKKINNKNTIVDIRTQGSEVFIPEWENTIGLAFSSPPYFYLEDYKVGDQSYKEGMSYEEWKDGYLEPTFKNIYRYLIKKGFFLLNINNFKDIHLVEDSIDIAKKVGFVHIGEDKLINPKRCNILGGFNDNSEKIIVFVKDSFLEDLDLDDLD